MPTRLPHTSRVPRPALQAATACVLMVLCITPALGAASLSSASDFEAGKVRAEAELMADRAACDKLAGNPRDVCREQARGKEMVAKAELELAHTGTRRSRNRVANVKLDTAYDLARTLCNDQAGSAKSMCAKDAQAVRAKGQADLMPNPHVIDARHDATDERREAAYKLAAEKCDAMEAKARAGCLAAAKANAGKT